MAMDAYIYFAAADDTDVSALQALMPEPATIKLNDLRFDYPNELAWKYWSPIQDATHEVDCDYWRYYGPGYEKGPGDKIVQILRALLDSGLVTKVWYSADSEIGDPITRAKVDELARHWEENGNRLT